MQVSQSENIMSDVDTKSTNQRVVHVNYSDGQQHKSFCHASHRLDTFSLQTTLHVMMNCPSGWKRANLGAYVKINAPGRAQIPALTKPMHKRVHCTRIFSRGGGSEVHALALLSHTTAYNCLPRTSSQRTKTTRFAGFTCLLGRNHSLERGSQSNRAPNASCLRLA